MGIAPIPGIRLDTVETPRKAEGVERPHFVVESSARSGDDAYSPSRQQADRGLADEQTDEGGGDGAAESETTPPDPLTGTQVNFIA